MFQSKHDHDYCCMDVEFLDSKSIRHSLTEMTLRVLLNVCSFKQNDAKHSISLAEEGYSV